jgi:hypothetical protein
VALSPALAACGGGGGGGDDGNRLSANQYRSKLAVLDQSDSQAHANAELALKAKSVAEVRKRMKQFALDEQALSDELNKLRPPKDAEGANEDFARGAHDYSVAIAATVAQLSSVTSVDEAFAILRGGLGNTKGGREIDAALTELKKKGYGSG